MRTKLATSLGALALALALAAPYAFAARQATEAAAPEALARSVRSVVGLRVQVPPDARTAETLGTERSGSGVVIDEAGLVLTIGYLILEAHAIEVLGDDGKAAAATVVGYDHETGFGLVRTVTPLGLAPIRLGSSADLAESDPVLAVGFGGRQALRPQVIASRRTFAGSWEYLLDDAIFTAPPHLQFGGAALINAQGRLVGIGSLFVNDAAAPGLFSPGNMFVPIDGLKPILADLIDKGRRQGPMSPWLGAYTAESEGRLLIARVAPGSPAERAGLKTGDVITGVAGKRVSDMIDYLRKVREAGAAGVEIALEVVRAGQQGAAAETVRVRSADRYEWLKLKRRGY